MKYSLFSLTALLVFSLQSNAEECSVNDVSRIPWKMELSSEVKVCQKRGAEIRCAEQNALNYSAVAIGLGTAAGACGAKSSELKLNGKKLEGTIVLCSSGTETGRYPLTDCQCTERKSKDGKYDLHVCYQQGSNEVITLAFKSGATDKSSGYILMNSAGNPEVLTVNAMTCGEKRTKSTINPPKQRQSQARPGEASS